MPTALELTPADRQRYIEIMRRQAAAQVTLARPEATRKRKLLVERARRVILFGSLAHEAWFDADSDVDMAVEGLVGDTYWEAWRLIEQFITDRPVDLVEIEAARPSLRQSIERDGIPL